MLTFIGLGLYDARDISLKGRDCIDRADLLFLECYTSRLMGSTIAEMEAAYGKSIRLLTRDDVERRPEEFLALAKERDAAFLTAGDPMVSTTHIDLRMRAAAMGIPTAVIHGASISSAACGLSGLQNYRFGKSCSLPFPYKNWAPSTPIEVVARNLRDNLHTLVYLDIQEERYMRIGEAVGILERLAGTKGLAISLYVGVARAGSDRPVIAAGNADRMQSVDFGGPLHILIVPAGLHVMERAYLEMFAGL
jgi:diphthine synthase